MVAKIEDETDKTAEERHMVLKQIKILKATNPTELTEKTGLDYDLVQTIVNFYLMKGVLERVHIHPDLVDCRIKARLPEMHLKGIDGYNAFKRKKFVGFKLDGLNNWLNQPEQKQLVEHQKIA